MGLQNVLEKKKTGLALHGRRRSKHGLAAVGKGSARRERLETEYPIPGEVIRMLGHLYECGTGGISACCGFRAARRGALGKDVGCCKNYAQFGPRESWKGSSKRRPAQ